MIKKRLTMTKYALCLKSDNERLTTVTLSNSSLRYKIDEDILAYNYFIRLKKLDEKSFNEIFYIDKL